MIASSTASIIRQQIRRSLVAHPTTSLTGTPATAVALSSHGIASSSASVASTFVQPVFPHHPRHGGGVAWHQQHPHVPRHHARQVHSSAPPRSDVELMELGMPALSPTMEAGNIASWNKAVGERIEAGDVLCEIETDKATVAFESAEEGYLAVILSPDGTQEVPVGAPIGYMVEEESEVEAAKAAVADKASATAAASSNTAAAAPVAEAAAELPAAVPAASASTTSSSASSTHTHGTLSPAVDRLVRESRVDPSSIAATGPKGNLLKGDVLAALASGAAVIVDSAAASSSSSAIPASAAVVSDGDRSMAHRTFTDVELTTMRKVIAQRLSESKATVPHAYAAADCVMDRLIAFRKAMKAATGGGVGSVNDFVIRAAALALRDVPAANAVYDAAVDGARLLDSVDVSVAVATDGGLITPIVKAAHTKRVSEIQADVRDLAGRARGNKLKPEEFMGGSFTISNLGMFGITSFSAVINPPQACILAVGGSEARVMMEAVDSDAIVDVDDDEPPAMRPVTRSVMSVTLSYDERVIDGAVAAQLLSAFQHYIEHPDMMV